MSWQVSSQKNFSINDGLSKSWLGAKALTIKIGQAIDLQEPERYSTPQRITIEGEGRALKIRYDVTRKEFIVEPY